MSDTITDCRSEDGITVGLIDSIITAARVLAGRDKSSRSVAEALKDLSSDEDLRDLLSTPVAESQEPVAYVLTRDAEVCYEADDGIVISNTPGDETDLYKWEPVYMSPRATGAWRPLESVGQIKQGDWLSFTVAGSFFCAQAKLIIDPGTEKEEIVYNRQKNHYFITSMAVDGTSTHKGVLIARQKNG